MPRKSTPIRDSISGVDTKKLDDQLKALRKMNLLPVAMAAAVAEIEKEWGAGKAREPREKPSSQRNFKPWGLGMAYSRMNDV